MKNLLITREDLPTVFKYKHPTVTEREAEVLLTIAFALLYAMFGLSVSAVINGWPL